MQMIQRNGKNYKQQQQKQQKQQQKQTKQCNPAWKKKSLDKSIPNINTARKPQQDF